MNAPAPVRCPKCQYQPASAVTVCPVCKHEAVKPFQGIENPCIYERKECDCGLSGKCLNPC